MSSIISPAAPEVLFGGPDRPPRFLRDQLKARIEAVPTGGAIDWATYYFRDRDLARALIAASDRGAEVRLCLEGAPRRASANRAVIEMLAVHGLRGGLRVQVPTPVLARLHMHMHLKIYAFSHPQPVAHVGSFNPSGDEPEDEEVIAEIGDQDRGHNMLVGFRDPVLYEGLTRHVRRQCRAGAYSLDRLRWGQNRVLRGARQAVYFFPRLLSGVIDRPLSTVGAGASIRGAVSHLKNGPLTRTLIRAARRGASVRLVVHATERRVPTATIERLAAGGIEIKRYCHPDGLPLHAKFLLIETPRQWLSCYGSFNFNSRSRYLNHELLVLDRDPRVADELGARFEEIARVS